MTRTLKVLIAVAIVVFLAFVFVGSTGASVEPQVVRVTLKDYQIGLSQFLVTPGKAVTLVIVNEGDLPHQLAVQRYADTNANVAASPVIGSHTAREIQLTLAPGVYRIACVQWDHAERGMVNVVAADTVRSTAMPIQMDFVIPLLGLVLGSVYIIGDSIGLRLTRR